MEIIIKKTNGSTVQMTDTVLRHQVGSGVVGREWPAKADGSEDWATVESLLNQIAAATPSPSRADQSASSASAPLGAGQSSGFISLTLAAISHLFWLIPMIAGNQVFHVDNQGVAELIPLIGLPIAIFAIVHAVRSIKTKPGRAVAGLIIAILAIMMCVAAVLALPGPLQPMIGL